MKEKPKYTLWEEIIAILKRSGDDGASVQELSEEIGVTKAKIVTAISMMKLDPLTKGKVNIHKRRFGHVLHYSLWTTKAEALEEHGRNVKHKVNTEIRTAPAGAVAKKSNPKAYAMINQQLKSNPGEYLVKKMEHLGIIHHPKN